MVTTPPSPAPARSWAWWIAAVLLAIVALIEWWWIHHHDPGAALTLLSSTGTQFLFGREGGILVGLLGGAPPWLVWQYSLMADIIETLIGVALAWSLLGRRRAGSGAVRLRRAQESVAARLASLGRWRASGLFAFTLVPFMLNGPVLAAFAGRLIGLGPRASFLAVAGGSFVAGTAWTMFALGVVPLISNALLVVVLGCLFAAGLARTAWRRFTHAPPPTGGRRRIEPRET